jgi:ABC-type bacteriocin/lantibiotic exporter with double-glycine peptidase domain
MIKQNSEKNYLDIIFGFINVLMAISWYPRELQLIAPATFALFSVILYSTTKFLSNKIRTNINKRSDSNINSYLSILHVVLFAVLLVFFL